MRNHLYTGWYWLAGLAVLLMATGSLTQHTMLRAWALGIGLIAFGLWRRKCDADNEARFENYVQRWAHQPFEAGWQARGISDQIRR